MSEEAKRRLEVVRERIFEETQAELPEDERVAPSWSEMCRAKHDGFVCTRRKHHGGPHVAHGHLGDAVGRWER